MIHFRSAFHGEEVQSCGIVAGLRNEGHLCVEYVYITTGSTVA